MKVLDQRIEPTWAMYHGDCVDVLRGLPDDSIHYSVFSPPFPSMYVYTDQARDMGNVQSVEQMIEQMVEQMVEQSALTWLRAYSAVSCELLAAYALV